MDWIWSSVPKSKYIPILRWHKIYGCPIAVYYDPELNPNMPWITMTKTHMWPEASFLDGVYAKISAPVLKYPTAEA